MRRLGWALVALACLGLLPARAQADDLADVREAGVLLWGADQEGGGPYVYPREDDPDTVTGFEVDLAAALGRYLGVEARFAQGPWDHLLDLLRARKVAVVLNGYEWTPERVEGFEASIPYCVYALQLLVRDDDASLGSWDDLKRARPSGPRKVGVLTGSAAETYLRDALGEACEIVTYDGNTDAMREVETGKLDATLQDTPIARFYAKSFPRLKPIGDPVAPGYYVAYVRQGERALLQAVNEALILLIRNGELERILARYGIWDGAQAELAALAAHGRFYGYLKATTIDVAGGAAPTAREVERTAYQKHGMEIVRDYSVTLLKSAGMTVLLALLSFPLAVILGLLVAIGRVYGPGWVARPLGVYVELLRGTPLMLQLYFIFFLLPEVGINVPALATAILGLAVNYSAYEAEIYRAGLQAVPRGQLEAALALGMSRRQAVQRIVVPQAVRIVIPPVMNDFIALFKDTSVCSVVTVVELTKRFSVLAMSTQAVLELMGLTCLLYLLMSYPLALLSRRVERRLGAAGGLA